jgi:class 3 adenylate cyclase/tetratricopeptide (TPR) repeat protein
MRGERRVVTVLFCDVTGSTAMAEHLDPEEWAEIMGEAFDYLTRPVQHYEGNVARLMGDGILAFFGAPVAHEDDPQRGILAGLDIIAGIQPFRDQIQREYNMEFNVRVGINTGPVVVGEIGTDFAGEYTAMGDAVNLAARMEQTAEPGSVQVSAHTYHSAKPFFDFEALGDIAMKGKSEPVAAYRAIRRKSQPGSGRGIEGLNSPLVGRGMELSRLRQALDEVGQGRGQIVFLVGEAGLGKSRLIAELRREALNKFTGPYSWIEARGIAYEANRPYGVFRQLLEQVFPVGRIDELETIRLKVLPLLQGEMGQYFDNLMDALGMGAAQPSQSEVDSRNAQQVETARHQLKESVYAIWAELARGRPSVAVFDDLHWADTASMDLLQYLFRLCDEAPILFLCATRPMRHTAAWQTRQYAETEFPHAYTELVISPLTNVDSHTLVDSLLPAGHTAGAPANNGEAKLLKELHQVIMNKAEGNPLFVEELVRVLIDNGQLRWDQDSARWEVSQAVEDIQLPESLQGLLTARIDRLEPLTRQTLQAAAVIGRVFSDQVLEKVVGTWQRGEKVNLDEQLLSLQRAGLVRERRRVPERELIFHHELIRDAAYQSILLRQRRQIHRLVGEAIESVCGTDLDEEAPSLVGHFREAQDYHRAWEYALMAGDHAYRLYAYPEAIAMYGQAIELAGKARPPVEAEPLLQIYRRRGRALEFFGEYAQALENYEMLERLGNERGDQRLELAALVPQAIIYSTYTPHYNPTKGQEIAERALKLAQSVKDPRAEAQALWALLLARNYTAQDPVQSLVYGKQALKIARQHNLREEQAYILNDLSRVYILSGHMKETYDCLTEAQKLWRELDNQPMLADSLNNLAESLHMFAEFDRSIQVAGEALEIGRKIGNLWGQSYSLMIVGPVYHEKGLVGQSMRALRQSIVLAEQAKFQAPPFMSRLGLSWIHAHMGDYEGTARLIEEALVYAQAAGTLFYSLESHRVIFQALLLLAQGKPEEAIEKLGDLDENYIPSISEIYYGPPIIIFLGEIYLANRRYQELYSHTDLILRRSLHSGVHLFAPDMHLYKGKALAGLGQTEEALQILEAGQQEARSQGSLRSLWQILAFQARLYDQQGDSERTAGLRQEAQQIASFIADQIVMTDGGGPNFADGGPNPAGGGPDAAGEGELLRRSFLELPEVRELYAGAR